VRGRVVGFTPAELGALGVCFLGHGDERSELFPPAPDGTFELAGLPLRDGALVLFRAEGKDRQRAIAYRALALEGDVEGIELADDPLSLPEKQTRR
jgi:hypothetical protein